MKLATSFAVLVALFVGLGLMLFSSLDGLRDAAHDKETASFVTNQADNVMTDVLEEQSAVRAYAILGESPFLKLYHDHQKALQQHAAAFRERTRVPEQKQRLDALLAAVARMNGKLDRVITLYPNPATRPEAQQLAGSKQLDEIRAIMGAIKNTQADRIAATTARENTAHDSAKEALIFGGLAQLALAIGMAWLLSSVIAKPVRSMTDVMRRLAGGDNGVPVPHTDRTDEIGSMAKAVLVFKEAAIAQEKADAAKKMADAEQKRVVETLTSGLTSVATGDLTADITVDFAPEYAAVKVNFNNALSSLRELIGAVGESASSIRTGSGEIAHASEDLARRTESNAASLEQTSAALAQIDGRLKASAVAAARTVERADQANSTVIGGRSVADQAVQAMGRVSDSARGIDSVIEGVDKIAFQTRVLAMNAAVEAGRAGEAGRGFAVVADLVGQLAMRSEEEAKQARDQLTVTQADIITAVESVHKVDGALADISGAVGEVHQLIGSMAADNQAQSAAITEISAAISTMDHATQQNAAMVEQTSAAARNLSNEVASLSEQATRFQVDIGKRRLAAAGLSATGEWPGTTRSLPAAAIPALTRSVQATDDWSAF